MRGSRLPVHARAPARVFSLHLQRARLPGLLVHPALGWPRPGADRCGAKTRPPAPGLLPGRHRRDLFRAADAFRISRAAHVLPQPRPGRHDRHGRAILHRHRLDGGTAAPRHPRLGAASLREQHFAPRHPRALPSHPRHGDLPRHHGSLAHPPHPFRGDDQPLPLCGDEPLLPRRRPALLAGRARPAPQAACTLLLSSPAPPPVSS